MLSIAQFRRENQNFSLIKGDECFHFNHEHPVWSEFKKSRVSIPCLFTYFFLTVDMLITYKIYDSYIHIRSLFRFRHTQLCSMYTECFKNSIVARRWVTYIGTWLTKFVCRSIFSSRILKCRRTDIIVQNIITTTLRRPISFFKHPVYYSITYQNYKK